MEEAMKAFYDFWSSFDIPAYPEDGVPDDAVLPYITYNVIIPHWASSAVVNARVWYRSTSYAEVTAKAQAISERIGEGVAIGGGVYLFKEDNFLQFQPYDASEDTIKVAYLSMIAHVLSN